MLTKEWPTSRVQKIIHMQVGENHQVISIWVLRVDWYVLYLLLWLKAWSQPDPPSSSGVLHLIYDAGRLMLNDHGSWMEFLEWSDVQSRMSWCCSSSFTTVLLYQCLCFVFFVCSCLILYISKAHQGRWGYTCCGSCYRFVPIKKHTLNT